MSEFQYRLLEKMVQLLQDFDHGKMSFHVLVSRLEEAIERADFRDQELVRKWYEYFNPIEEAESEAWHEMEDPDYEKVHPYLQKLKDFILEQEQSFNSHPLHHPAHRKPAHAKN